MAMPLGAAVGAGAAGLEILMDKTPMGSLGPVPQMFTAEPIPERIQYVGKALQANMTNLENYKFLLGGMLISAAPRIPVIRVLARPLDSAVRRLGKGKVSL